MQGSGEPTALLKKIGCIYSFTASFEPKALLPLIFFDSTVHRDGLDYFSEAVLALIIKLKLLFNFFVTMITAFQAT